MQDAARVRQRHGVGDAVGDLERGAQGQRAAAVEVIGERAPGDVLHDDVVAAVVEAPEIERARDAVAAERRRHQRLLHEAAAHARRVGQFAPEHLERGEGVGELLVSEQVHHAHPAPAELPLDDEIADALSEERLRWLFVPHPAQRLPQRHSWHT